MMCGKAVAPTTRMPAPHSRSADTRSGSRERCCRALSLVAMSSGEPTETISPPISSERSEEHTSELQSRFDLVCRLLLEKKKKEIQKPRYKLGIYLYTISVCSVTNVLLTLNNAY